MTYITINGVDDVSGYVTIFYKITEEDIVGIEKVEDLVGKKITIEEHVTIDSPDIDVYICDIISSATRSEAKELYEDIVCDYPEFIEQHIIEESQNNPDHFFKVDNLHDSQKLIALKELFNKYSLDQLNKMNKEDFYTKDDLEKAYEAGYEECNTNSLYQKYDEEFFDDYFDDTYLNK